MVGKAGARRGGTRERVGRAAGLEEGQGLAGLPEVEHPAHLPRAAAVTRMPWLVTRMRLWDAAGAETRPAVTVTASESRYSHGIRVTA